MRYQEQSSRQDNIDQSAGSFSEDSAETGDDPILLYFVDGEEFRYLSEQQGESEPVGRFDQDRNAASLIEQAENDGIPFETFDGSAEDGEEGLPEDGYAPYILYLTEDDDNYNEYYYNATENGYIYALGGDDTIATRSFGVHVFGGDGNDTLIWRYQPPALLDGGDGEDTLDLSQLSRGVEVDLNTGEADTFVPLFSPHDGPVEIRNIEHVVGTDYQDNIFGDANDNILDGGGMGDIIFGGAGNDTIIGGASSYSDTLHKDILSGGAGDDIFYFRTAEEAPVMGSDIITDFEQGSDTIVFESAYGFGPITFRPADWSGWSDPAFSGVPLDPRENYLLVNHTSSASSSAETQVQIFLTTGHDHEYARITLTGHHDLTTSDFMFV